MEYEKIKQLIEDIGNSKLTSVDIDFPDGTKISMKKEIPHVVSGESAVRIIEKDEEKNETNETNSIETNKKETEETLNIIKSPMVGTFYSKPSPTSEPFCKTGKRVTKGTTVCIIEAMKLMNEIESEFDGEIVDVYVKDGDAVEYGTKLFGIKQ